MADERMKPFLLEMFNEDLMAKQYSLRLNKNLTISTEKTTISVIQRKRLYITILSGTIQYADSQNTTNEYEFAKQKTVDNTFFGMP